MDIKKLPGRYVPKGDTEANWNKAVGFVPLKKEIIIYLPDETHRVARFKIGDGETPVQNLDFAGADMKAIEKLIDEKGELLVEYVDNAVAALPQVDWNQNDEAAKDYIKNKPFGEQSFEITWDGVVGNRDVIDISGDGNFIIAKISDKIFTYEDYLGATISIVTPDGTENISITQEDMYSKEELEAKGIYSSRAVAGVISFFDLNKAENVVGIRPPSTGTYFMKAHQNNIYVSSFSNSKVTKLDEKYIPDSIIEKNNEQDDKIAELEGRVTTATFNITAENTTTILRNLIGMTKIDWGDGTIDNNLTHIYTQTGEYTCKIFDVVNIENKAFHNCYYLNSLVLGNSVTSIGDYAFDGCSNLTSMTMSDSVISIGEGAFCNCHTLKSITIPDSVMSIGSKAFYNCDSLTSIKIPDSVMSIGNRAFESCDSLKSIEIPDSVMSIEFHTFWSCDSLTSVEISNNVSKIGDGAFAHCDSLTSITIPDSVMEIGLNAFYGCSGLTSVTFKNFISNINDRFSYCTSLIHIYVPYGCKSEYVDKWSSNGTSQDILDKIAESDREAMMSDVNELKGQIPNNRNLEDGVALDSLQQKHSLALGARSIALGGAITTPEAEKSFAMAASVAKNNCVFAANEYTTAEGWASATFGGQTKASFPYMFACGFNNENKEENILEVGLGEYKYELVAERPTYEQAMTELKYYRNLGDKGYERITPMNCPTEADYAAITGVFEFTGQGWNAFEVTKTGVAKAGGVELVKNTDYAHYADSGLVRGNGGNQFRYFFQNGMLYLQGATDIQIENRQTYVGLTADNIDKAVKAGITTNTETLTDEEKEAIANWLASEDIKNYQLVSRSSAGHIAVPLTPNASYMATSKYYVDNNFVAKPTGTSGYNRVIGFNAALEQMDIFLMYPNYTYDESSAKSRNGIPIMDNGNIGCALPTADYHTANKKYVDDLVGDINTVLEAIMGV